LLHSGDLGPATCRRITDFKRWFLEGADIRNDADIAEEVLAFVAAARRQVRRHDAVLPLAAIGGFVLRILDSGFLRRCR